MSCHVFVSIDNFLVWYTGKIALYFMLDLKTDKYGEITT